MWLLLRLSVILRVRLMPPSYLVFVVQSDRGIVHKVDVGRRKVVQPLLFHCKKSGQIASAVSFQASPPSMQSRNPRTHAAKAPSWATGELLC